MSNLTWDGLISFIQAMETPYLRINDITGKRLFEILDIDDVKGTIAKLEEFRPQFEQYGRLRIVAANESIKKANWQNAYNWTVLFNGAVAKQEAGGNISISGAPLGYISKHEGELMATNKMLEYQILMNKQMNEMQLQIMGMNKNDPMNYLPALALVFDIDDKKLEKMLKLSSISGAMQGKNTFNQPAQQGMAGVEANVKMTQEEADIIAKNISVKLQELCAVKGLKNIEKLVSALHAKPELVDTALTFFNA